MNDRKLTPGEHVDLDSGITVRRRREGQNDDEGYWVKDLAQDDLVALDRDDVRELAELAGFEVRDP